MNLTSGELYFINEVDVLSGAETSFYKVGLVKDLRQGDVGTRVDEHQTGNPRRLVVVDRVDSPAISDLEKTVHNRFARWRVLGEWFVLDRDQLAEVASAARMLATEQIDHLPALEAAAASKDEKSNGSNRTPSAGDVEWYRSLLAAKSLAARVKTLKDRSDAAFKAAIERDVDVSLFAGWTERTRNEFDKDKFLESYAELAGQFMKEKFVSPRFTTRTNSEIEIPTPSEEFVDFEHRFAGALSRSDEGSLDAERLHRLHLELLGFQARAKWDSEFAEANLKVACGPYDGLEGLVGWKRERRLQLDLEVAAVKREHPDIYAEFARTIPTRSFAVIPMRSYSIS